MALGFLFLAAWLTMAVAPETPIARMLSELLVVAPAGWLAGLERRAIVATAILLLIAAALALLADGEAVRIFALGAPEIANMLLLFDVSALIDLAVATMFGATTVRWRSLTMRRPRSQGRTRRRHVKPRAAANDEDGPTRRLLAA